MTHDYTWIGNNIESEHIDDAYVWMLLIQNIAEYFKFFFKIFTTHSHTFWTHVKILINSQAFLQVSVKITLYYS